MAQIGISAHLLSAEAGYRRAGIHHYIAQTLQHLPTDGYEYTTFTQYPDPLPPTTTLQPSRWPTHQRIARILWEQTALPFQLWQRPFDLLHSTAFVLPVWLPCPAIVTVYDLSFMHTPDAFPRGQQRYLASQTRRSCQQATRVITISESSKQDVHKFFSVPLNQIDVVYPGVTPAPILPVETLPENYILHVGTLQPRKNIPTLLEAFAQLPDQTLHLVLVGGKGWLFDEIFAKIEHLQLTNRVIFSGYVPDEALPAWYAGAKLLVFPSLYEGFGIPIVEAMTYGTPVVASNISSIPEAGGEAALYFDPHNPAQLAEQMQAVLTDPALSARMKRLGIEHAKRFSWERAGRQTAVSYQHALH